MKNKLDKFSIHAINRKELYTSIQTTKGFLNMSSKEKSIGLVGVGRMGANMARNLKDRGYRLSCVNDVIGETKVEVVTE